MNLSLLDAGVLVVAIVVGGIVAALIVGAIEKVRVARWDAHRPDRITEDDHRRLLNGDGR